MSGQKARFLKAAEEFRGKIEELFASGRVKEFLEFLGRFRKYSFQNMLLVFIQRPDATRVAGLRTWNKLGRRVKKGERGIRIMAPVFAKKKDRPTEDENPRDEHDAVVYYRMVSVFDVGQTEGDDVPVLSRPLETAHAGGLLDKLIRVSPVPVQLLELRAGGPNGWYVPQDKRIVVSSVLARDMQVKTLLHEMAHALSDPDGVAADSAIQEVVAEGAAHLVAGHLGLDTAAYSVGYVAAWGKDLEKILEAGDRMISVAGQILDRLEHAKPVEVSNALSEAF